MDREIKFRAWSKEEEKMYPVKCLELTKDQFYDKDAVGNIFSIYDDDKVFMQYTGLKDKNGKEIYEGDILEEERVQTWTETGKARCIVEDIRFIEHVMSPRGYRAEVIGNKFEDPELLED